MGADQRPVVAGAASPEPLQGLPDVGHQAGLPFLHEQGASLLAAEQGHLAVGDTGAPDGLLHLIGEVDELAGIGGECQFLRPVTPQSRLHSEAG